jgi:hypothetical protein
MFCPIHHGGTTELRQILSQKWRPFSLTTPQVFQKWRHILAVRRHRGLKLRIEIDTKDRCGPEAVRALATAMRNFALEHPGLSAATFRNPASDRPDWQQAGAELQRVAFLALSQVGLEGEQAAQALRILRSLVRGFVISEMAASFFVDPLEYQQTFDCGIEVFIRGLPALG